ncbi:MAG: hypothetical protein RI973_1502, partial [Bacteroidota bacterium]
NNGSTKACTATVTVADTVKPLALCKNLSVSLDGSGSASVSGTDIDNNSTDACGIASLQASPGSFTCADTCANTVTLTVTDNKGNTASCTATVTVSDTILPTALCKAATVQLSTDGQGILAASQVNNGSSDICGIGSLAVSPDTFTCANTGANSVMLTVTDNNGNTATCVTSVTVADTVAPVANCFAEGLLLLDSTNTASLTTALIDSLSGDACGLDTLHLSETSFTLADTGLNIITLTVIDNNTNQSTCTTALTVRINDLIPPVALCKDLTLYLDIGGSASTTAAAVNNGSYDNTGIASLSLDLTSFTCTNVGVNMVTLTVTDNFSNSSTCTAMVTVLDNIPPSAQCINVTRALNAQGNRTVTAPEVNNNSTDTCGIAGITLSQTSFNCSHLGPNTVTLTVTDLNGNSSTCSSIITILDNTPPKAFCKNTSVVLDAQGNASLAAPAVNNNSTDVCGISNLTLSQSSFTCAHLGLKTVTLTVTDHGGNTATCTATVTVTDNTLPVATCKNATIQLNASGTAILTSAQVNNNSSDNCTFSLSLSQSTFTCAQPGINSVTLTATDGGGNSSSCTATVTVQDNLPPTALCKNTTVFLGANGQSSLSVVQISNGSSDNCGNPALTLNPAGFNCSNLGPNTVTLTATDAAGNTATCTATVTVADNLPPSLTCQNLTVQVDAQGQVIITPTQVYNAGASTDNCGGSPTPVSVSPSLFYCSNLGPNTVTLTASDAHGNTATCQATVTVLGLFVAVNATVTPEFCGGDPGSIAVTLPGVSGQVAYSINGGASWQFSNVFNNLSAGNYQLSINIFGNYGCGVSPTVVTVPLVGELTNTWTGNGNGISWALNPTWSLGYKPIPCHNVVIPAGFDVELTTGTEGLGRTLTVAAGSTLTVAVGGTLTIGGN